MTNTIICLTDYKGYFGSKWLDVPYRSGMDKNLLKKYFSANGISVKFKNFSEVDLSSPEIKNQYFIYTSSEDIGYLYKSFIEDIVLGIQEAGGKVIPEFKFLRATNNKVFMEALRKSHLNHLENPKSFIYGSLEEVDFNQIEYPIVFKSAGGSMSQGVALAKNKDELIKIIRERCRARDFKNDFRDILRKIKRKGYVMESLYRNKFVLQEYLPNLTHDYKVLIFADKFYIFQRPVRKDDFRASGSGAKRYLYGSKVKVPDGIFDFAESIFRALKVPHLSLDIAYANNKFYLIEFQTVYFGTVGHHESDGYYAKLNGKWELIFEKYELEQVYSDTICKYLKTL